MKSEGNERNRDLERKPWRSNGLLKLIAMYLAMVVVSTLAIHFLEHVTIANAFRTALVAAIGKTVAASWVSGIFD